MRSIDPTSGETIAEYDEHTPEQVDSRLTAVHRAQFVWSDLPISGRAERMKRVAVILQKRREEFARLMAREMGKPIIQGRAEVDKCSWVCDFYADEAETFLAPRRIRTEASQSYVAFRPLGVLLAVMPWNFPFWQVFRFAAPALMAGNACVLKHASNVPGAALAIEEVFAQAGFDEHLFASLLIGSDRVEQVIGHRSIRGVSLTGSTPAGRAVAAAAGAQIKKTVLELGGSDAYLVLGDADLKAAARACAESRLINSGQSCIAAKRFVVVHSVKTEFERSLVDEMRAYPVGEPLDEKTRIGPMARADLRDELHEQVVASVEAGARLLVGGEIPDRKGAWYPPTVLTDVPEGCPARDEELFGPVAAIIQAADETEAVEIANETVFGLGAAVFTSDEQRGLRIADERLEAGACFVNTFVRSDPRLPFGGIKESGYGRELGAFGIRELTNIKTVYVR